MPREEEERINKLIDTYGNMVYRLAISRLKSKEEAEDIFQEVFLKIYQKMPIFDDKEHEKYWIIRVTINLSKNFLLGAWHRKVELFEKELLEIQEYKKDEASNLQFEVDNNDNSYVYFEVLKLPLKYRTIIQLYYYENLSVSEISRILKINPNTVKTRLKRAREKLKIKLEGGF